MFVGIVTFTVALSASQEFKPADRAFLEGLTTGAGSGCGSLLSSATGEFIEVRDRFDLFFVFSNLIGPTQLGPPCEPGRCPNPNQFVAKQGLSGFVLSASAPLPGVELALTDPSGRTTNLSGEGPEVVSVPGVTISQHWIRSRSAEIEARFDPDSRAWRGKWRFLFFTPDTDDTPVPAYVLSLQSDLRPTIIDRTALVRGGDAELELALIDHTGNPVRSGTLADGAVLRAEAIDATGAARPLTVKEVGAGRFQVTIEVPEDAVDGRWTLAAEVSYPSEPNRVEPSFASLPLGLVQSPSKPDPWWQVVLAAAFLLALALTALTVAYRRRLSEAKFTAPQLLRVLECDAVVRPGGIVTLDPDPGRPGYDDFARLRSSGRDARVSRLKHAPFEFRGHVSRRLRGEPVGEVSAAHLQLLGGGLDGPLSSSEDRRKCRVPLGLAGTWLLAVEAVGGNGAARGRLVVFTDEDSPAELGARTLDAARSALAAQDWDGFERGAGDDDVADPDDPDERQPLVDVEDVDWGSI